MNKKTSQKSEVEQGVMVVDFLQQFSAAEQAQLMTWVERLFAQGRVEVDETNPLSGPFNILTKYISRQIDTLPPSRS